MFKTIQQIIDKCDNKRIEKYPPIKLDGIFNSESYTGRVCFDKKHSSFSLYVYPTIEDGFNAYEFSCSSIEELHIKWVPHLMEKKWFNKDLYFDLINLGKEVIK